MCPLQPWRRSASRFDTLRYAVLYADAFGVTHFRDEVLPWYSSSTTDPTVVWRTDYQDATDVGFLRLLPEYDNTWHSAPRKQFLVIMQGIVEVQAGDGHKRRFEVGEVLLVTDTEGPGHLTTVVSETDTIAVWVPIP